MMKLQYIKQANHPSVIGSISHSMKFLFISGFVLLSLCMTMNAYAYKLIPLSVEMSPKGKGARQIFRVENPSKEPIAVEFKIRSRKMTEMGQDILSDAENDFVIYPTQAIVMPGQSQAVRVQWMGNAKPEQELAYRLISEQLPVSFDKNQSDGGQLKLLVRFIASIYIVPQNARPVIKVQKALHSVNKQGQQHLVLQLENEGEAHVLLRDPVLSLMVNGLTVSLKKEQLALIASQNILAGHRREFRLPWPKELPTGVVKATLQYRGQ